MFEIIDDVGDQYGSFSGQDTVMRTIFYLLRNARPIIYNKYSVIYVNPDESQLLSGYLGETRFIDWVKEMEHLRFTLRLKTGSDLIGLADFIEWDGYKIDYKTCDCLKHILCPQRYSAIVERNGCGSFHDGYTVTEALAKSYLSIKEYESGKR
jgi:hypothetical protein